MLHRGVRLLRVEVTDVLVERCGARVLPLFVGCAIGLRATGVEAAGGCGRPLRPGTTSALWRRAAAAGEEVLFLAWACAPMTANRRDGPQRRSLALRWRLPAFGC